LECNKEDRAVQAQAPIDRLEDDDHYGYVMDLKKGIETSISRLPMFIPDVNIHAEFSLKNLSNMDGVTTCFLVNMANGRSGIHFTQISPEKLALFDKELYLQNNGDVELDGDKIEYINKLHGKIALCRTILREFSITLIQVQLEQRTLISSTLILLCPGVRFTRMFTTSQVDCGSTGGLWKYRTARDRRMQYGHGIGRFSLSLYGYIFTASNLQQAGFISVGVGCAESR
jgi:hypothetical protein